MQKVSWTKEFVEMCKANSFGEKCFIYFLLLNDVVTYVGQTTNLPGRISSHLHGGYIDFDDFQIIECKKHELDKLEKKFISLYLPINNSCMFTRKAKRDKMKVFLPEYKKRLKMCEYYELRQALISPGSTAGRNYNIRYEIMQKYENIIKLSTVD